MSFEKKNIFSSIPATTRGKPVTLGGDPKGENILYTCGNSVIIRNLNNPLICDTYNEHGYPPTVARYSPSGFYIASGDTTGTIRIWDTTQVEHILKIELRPLGGPVYDISWSDDSKRIVAVGEGKEKFGSVFMWDTGSSVGEISGHAKAITSVDFKKTRPYRIITGGEDNLVSWFEGPPFKFKHSMKDHTRFVNCVRFNADGSLCVSVSSDKKGVFYDGKTGEKKHELSTEGGHSGGIYGASFSGDGRQLLTASADKTSKLWDVETGKVVSTFTFGNDTEDQQLGCLWQKDHLISVSLSGYLNFLDTSNPSKPRSVVKGHNKFITAIAHNPSKNRVYSGSYDAQIVSWDITTGSNESFTGQGHTNQINRLLVANDTLVSAALDDSIRFTSISGGSLSNGDKVATEGPANSVSSNSSGNLAVAVSNKQINLIVNHKSVQQLAVPFEAKSVSLSPDDKEVAVAASDNHLYIYSISGNSLTQSKKLEGHRAPLTSVAWSPDGKHIASGDTNRQILLWDSGSKQMKFNGWVHHSARINALAWSPDNVHLASGSLDQNIFVWSAADETKRIQIKNSHHGGVNTLTWLSENTLASAGQDCCWKSWQFKY